MNLKELIARAEATISTQAKIAIGIFVTACIAYTGATAWKDKPSDKTQASVMIVTLAKNSGGSGVVIHSSPALSKVLTNSHVCDAVKHGGLVVSQSDSLLISKFIQSKNHDLCLIEVNGDLKAHVNVAKRAPVNFYEKAEVSGHPNLLPNVITSGHYSGRMIIQVMTGVKKCKADEQTLSCLFFGVKPVLKRYESNLVTSTIMAGSSGSGVYNEDGDLSNLVFAGAGQLSYAFTVPYEYLTNFLNSEINNLTASTPSDPTDDEKDDAEEEGMQKIKQACETKTSEDTEIKAVCKLVKNSTYYWAE